MKPFRIGIFLFIFSLAACRPGDDGNQSSGIDVVTKKPTQVQSLILGTMGVSTTTQTPTLEITTTAIITVTPIILPLRPTLEITATPTISSTVVTSLTSIITTTWTYTDVVVTRGGMINSVAWNPEGSNFAVATSVGLFLYDGISLETDRIFNVGESNQSVLFSPEDGLLVSGGLKGDIQWIAPDTGKYITTIEGHLFGITDLAFPKRSGYLISGSDDGTVRSWNPAQITDSTLTEHSPVNIWRALDRVTSVDINQKFQIVVAGSYQTWYVWDLITGESIFELGGFMGWISDLSINPGGEILAMADGSNHIRVWETSNWELTHDVQLIQVDQITALDFSPDGWTLGIGGNDGTVLMWDVRTNTLYETVEPYPYTVTDIKFHPNDDSLIISYDNGLLRLWLNKQ